MALPHHIAVKLSSEAAEAVALTPVVVQQIPVREFIETLLGVAGKDEARLQEILKRGSLTAGATRYRWAGFDVQREELDRVLREFPDPEPARAFAAQACTQVTLVAGARRVEIQRDAGAKRRLLRRTSYWDVLLEVAVAAEPRYHTYSYRHQADQYQAALTEPASQRLHQEASRLAYSSLITQVTRATWTRLELLVPRLPRK